MFKPLENIRNVGAVTVDRLELYGKLVAIESRIAAAVLARKAVWMGTGALFAALTVAMIHAAAVAHWWDTGQRLAAIFALMALDAIIAIAAIAAARRGSDPGLYAATVRELRTDLAFLKDSF
ncbi:MAG: hypothetical protein ABIS68_03200 [Casimicrobiaceae bacterium]